MFKWALTLFVALAVVGALQPALARRGLGRLPGDLTLHVRGREIFLPFTSTLLLSALLALVGRLL
jgi:hypothetical protein